MNTYSMLIVEGGEVYRNFLSDFFNTRDFAVTACSTYNDASHLAIKRRFDIAVVDYFIGHSNGKDLCIELLYGLNQKTSLIITSDQQTPQIEREIRMLAPAFYFVKPFSIDNLYAVVLKIFEYRDKTNLLKIKVDKLLMEKVKSEG